MGKFDSAIRIIGTGAFCFLVCFSTAAIVTPLKSAEKLNKANIVIFDMGRVLRDSAAARGMRQSVNDRRSTFQAAIESKRVILKGEEEQLRQQKSLLSPEGISKKQRLLEQKYSVLRQKREEYTKLLNEEVNRARIKLRKVMLSILTEVMKQKGADISMERGAVLVFDEQLNVTEEVLKALDENFSEIKIELPRYSGD